MLSKKFKSLDVDVCVCRQEFCSEAGPDLTKEMYLQDIHCVGSLCKLYFRELPNPLLTYELYSRFTVSTVNTICAVRLETRKSYQKLSFFKFENSLVVTLVLDSALPLFFLKNKTHFNFIPGEISTKKSFFVVDHCQRKD